MKTEFEGSSFVLKYCEGSSDLPSEIFDLRRKSFVVEEGIMAPHNASTHDDLRGVHTLLYEKSTGKLVACVHAQKASDCSHFQKVPRSFTRNLVYAQRLTIDSQFRGRRILPFILMAAVRPFRNQGFKEVAFFLDEFNVPVMRHYSPEPLPYLSSIQVPDISECMMLHPYSNTIEYWAHIGSKHSGPELADIKLQLYMDDIEQALHHNVKRFNQLSLWKKAKARSLRKTEWVHILSGLHQYVRFTTRTLAWAVGSSEDSKLRNSYIHHLKEEIDHEMIIEDDLKTLGADLDFYVSKRPTCPEAMIINSLGDSLLLARREPHFYLAIPFMLEGTTAFLEREHMESLLECIQTWGISDPESAAQILVSHLDFDSGDTGHHAHSFKMIKKFIVDEKSKSDFITIMNLAYQALDDLFSFQSEVSKDARMDRSNFPEEHSDFSSPQNRLHQLDGILPSVITGQVGELR